MTLQVKTLTQQEPATATPRVLHPRDYLSFTALATYRACPLKFYFHYLADLPEALVASSLVFGAAIHRSLEAHYRELFVGSPLLTHADLVAHYQAAWEEWKGPPIQYGEANRAALDRLAARMLREFLASELARPAGRILAVEEVLRGGLVPGVPDFVGRVDLITETPEALVITDWKTSRQRWSQEQAEDAAEQLVLYSELARDLARGKRVRLEIVVLTKTKDVSIQRHALPVEPRQVERMRQIVERIWQAISAGNFYPNPSPLNCHSCTFREPCRQWQG